MIYMADSAIAGAWRTDNSALLDDWIANWSDLVDFEVYPVMTSAAAAERIAPRL